MDGLHHPPLPRQPRWRHHCARLALACLIGFTPFAWGQGTPANAPTTPGVPAAEVASPPPEAPAPADNKQPGSDATLSDADQFVLKIDAPDTLLPLLSRHLELRRFQRLPDLGRSELERLTDLAPDNIRQLLGTQGYFTPQIEVRIEEPAAPDTPDASPAPLPTVQVRVVPGPRTRIASVTLLLQGEAQTLAASAPQRRELEREWLLPRSQPFTQSAWDAAKSRALRGFSSFHYPLARISNSLADIDPVAHEAHLYLEIDSGAAHQFGAIDVQGAERYDADMAARLVRLAGVRAGDPYDETQLQAAQQRLIDSGYYASAFVVLSPGDDPLSSAVEVRVREVPLQKVVAGVGVSTDNGARLSLEYTHHRMPGVGWRAVSKVQLERDASTLATEWSSPVDDQGWRWITTGQLQQQKDDPLMTRSQLLRLGQAQDSPLLDRSFFLQYDRAQVENTVTGQKDEAEASLSANYAWTRRRFDDLTQPTQGYGLAVELGLGVTLVQERRPYLRARARWQSYWPIQQTSSRPSRLALRVEGGAVWSQDGTPVPATQRFLTGGDNTVRGYSLREIGVPLANGGVEAGRFMTVTSLEWQRPLWLDGKRSDWETALFIDAGAVANHARDLSPKVGVGAGVRYRSPVGPLQADLAYGLDARRWRFHLSVGFTF